jgi:hypothetical protein
MTKFLEQLTLKKVFSKALPEVLEKRIMNYRFVHPTAHLIKELTFEYKPLCGDFGPLSLEVSFTRFLTHLPADEDDYVHIDYEIRQRLESEHHWNIREYYPGFEYVGEGRKIGKYRYYMNRRFFDPLCTYGDHMQRFSDERSGFVFGRVTSSPTSLF